MDVVREKVYFTKEETNFTSIFDTYLMLISVQAYKHKRKKNSGDSCHCGDKREYVAVFFYEHQRHSAYSIYFRILRHIFHEHFNGS